MPAKQTKKAKGVNRTWPRQRFWRKYVINVITSSEWFDRCYERHRSLKIMSLNQRSTTT
jgi:hypothetical protein